MTQLQCQQIKLNLRNLKLLRRYYNASTTKQRDRVTQCLKLKMKRKGSSLLKRVPKIKWQYMYNVRLHIAL